MYKYIFINFMCKWEWPFVSTDTKTNKYPLITEASFFFFFLSNFFCFYRKTSNTYKHFLFRRYMDLTDTCLGICTWGKLCKQVTLSMKRKRTGSNSDKLHTSLHHMSRIIWQHKRQHTVHIEPWTGCRFT